MKVVTEGVIYTAAGSAALTPETHLEDVTVYHPGGHGQAEVKVTSGREVPRFRVDLPAAVAEQGRCDIRFVIHGDGWEAVACAEVFVGSDGKPMFRADLFKKDGQKDTVIVKTLSRLKPIHRQPQPAQP